MDFSHQIAKEGLYILSLQCVAIIWRQWLDLTKVLLLQCDSLRGGW